MARNFLFHADFHQGSAGAWTSFLLCNSFLKSQMPAGSDQLPELISFQARSRTSSNNIHNDVFGAAEYVKCCFLDLDRLSVNGCLFGQYFEILVCKYQFLFPDALKINLGSYSLPVCQLTTSLFPQMPDVFVFCSMLVTER